MVFLQTLRKERGMSVEDLSRATGLSKSTIYNIESGGHCPNESTVQLLAEVFDVKVSEFRLPRGTTHLGKPAQAAGRTGKSSVKMYGEICPDCFTQRSLTGDCGNC